MMIENILKAAKVLKEGKTAVNMVKGLKEETNYIEAEIQALYKQHGAEMETIVQHCEQAILRSCENSGANLKMKSKEAKPNARNLLNNLEGLGYKCENIVYMKYLCSFMFSSSSLKEIAKIISEDIGMKILNISTQK